MWATLQSEYVIGLGIRFFIDVVAMLSLTLGFYYRRYGDKELVTSASLFNVFIFAVLAVLSNVDFGVTAGFGLFAILALFTLRSEQISKIEITYFFGSVSIAVICSIKGTSLPFVLVTTITVLTSAYLIDHPRLMPPVSGIKVTLDKIEFYALSDPDKMRLELSERLGVNVLSYQIKTLDFINDMVVLNVNYRQS